MVQIRESLLTSYRLDVEAIKDLHALISSALPDFTVTAAINCDVEKENESYTTTDVTKVVKETNGDGARVRSLTFRVNHAPELDLDLVVDQVGMRIVASAKQRAHLRQLVDNLRVAARPRMQGRGASEFARVLQWVLPPLVAVATLAATLFVLANEANSQRRSFEARVEEFNNQEFGRVQADFAELQEIAAASQGRADELLSGGTADQKLDFLISVAMDQLTYATSTPPEQVEFPNPPNDPWYLRWSTAVALGAFLLSLALSLVVAFRGFSAEHVFLLGAEVGRQARKDKRRTYVGVAVVTAILTGLVSTWLWDLVEKITE